MQHATLLFLAFLYSLFPPGLCVCRLQAAFLARVSSFCDPDTSLPAHGPEDDEDHDEHCPCAKKDCVTDPGPRIDAPTQAALATVAVAPALPAMPAPASEPWEHSLGLSDTPLYLTLRALLL